MLSTFQQPIWIGLNPQGSDKLCQGFVWVEDRDERTGKAHARSIPMVVRPSSAVEAGLTFFHHRRVISQLKKMGVVASTIEVRGKHRKYVYSADSYKVLLDEALPKPNTRALVNEIG